MYFYSILFLSFFFITSCSDPIVFPCNTKDLNRSCKIEPPQLVDISSFDVDTIRIIAMQNNEADSVKIHRVGINLFNEQESSVDSFNVNIYRNNQELSFKDGNNINPNWAYDYSFYYFNSDGYSDISNDLTIDHTFTGPIESTIELSIEQIENGVESIVLQWEATDQFRIEREEVSFKIIKTTYSEINGLPDINTVLDTIAVYPINTDGEGGNGSYQFIENFMPTEYEISYQYYIYEFRGDFPSTESISDDISINLPPISSTGWTPLSSKSIFLYWNFCETQSIQGEEYTLSLTNDLSINEDLLDGEETISNDNCSGYFIDYIDEYYPDVKAMELLTYILRWSRSDSDTYSEEEIQVATFPISNMVYVPSLNSLHSEIENELGISSSEGFYIDIFEVSEYLYENENEEFDGAPASFSNPKNVNAQDAISWCINRSKQIEINNSSIDIDFQVPTQLQWMIAAGTDYSSFNLIDTDNTTYINSQGNLESTASDIFYYTPKQSPGFLYECEYANIVGCGDAPIGVGSYNGTDRELATSPMGLYDCSGNLMEWVLDSSTDESANKLMGGFYNSDANDAQSNSLFIYNCQECIGTGFRTVIEAKNFLNTFKGAFE